jgi:uncharacterized protein YjbI with pentapeptide repeats
MCHNRKLIRAKRLNGARLNGVRLNGARLNGARLNGARLNGARLNGARLNGARLKRGTSLSLTHLKANVPVYHGGDTKTQAQRECRLTYIRTYMYICIPSTAGMQTHVGHKSPISASQTALAVCAACRRSLTNRRWSTSEENVGMTSS